MKMRKEEIESRAESAGGVKDEVVVVVEIGRAHV